MISHNYKNLIKSFEDVFPEHSVIDIKDGWYIMVLNLLKIISNHNRLKNSDIKILSIKNKFGKLRVYLSEYNDYLDGVLDAFEEQSFYICEKCGNQVSSSGFGTVCNNCK